MQTQSLTRLTVRPFTTNDYPDVVRLHNLTFAEFSMDTDEFRFEDALRVAPCTLARWVAECDGRIVGWAQYEQAPHIYHPRKFQFHISVDPEFYGQGIGRQLYDLLLGEVQRFDPLSVDEWSRTDMACRVGFLERRGFVEDMRMWTSALDLAAFEPAAFAEHVASVEQQGIQLKSWAELGFDDPQVRRRCYELYLAVREDVPLPPSDKRVETSFEQWWEHHNRPNIWPPGYFVAVDGEQYVGTSQLWLSPDRQELRTGTTGVRRDYRRRGIALALKVRSLEFARAQGYRRAVTENETNNVGMIGINDRLGFVKNPAWAHYLKTFAT